MQNDCNVARCLPNKGIPMHMDLHKLNFNHVRVTKMELTVTMAAAAAASTMTAAMVETDCGVPLAGEG